MYQYLFFYFRFFCINIVIENVEAFMLYGGFTASLNHFVEWLEHQKFSKKKIEDKLFHLSHFFDWAERQGLLSPQDITKIDLEHYKKFLCSYHIIKLNCLMEVQEYFKWLFQQKRIRINPTCEIESSQIEKKHEVTGDWVEQVSITFSMILSMQ